MNRRRASFRASLLASLVLAALFPASPRAGEPSALDALKLSAGDEADLKETLAKLAAPSLGDRLQATVDVLAYGPAARPVVEAFAKGEGEAPQAAARLLERQALQTNLPVVRIALQDGAFEAVLLEDGAPNAVANFIMLAERDFYCGLAFHRVIEQFMVQGGDPTGTGRGGPGYRFADEIDAKSLGLDKLTVKELAQKLKQKAPKEPAASLSVKELYEKQGYRYTDGLASTPMRRGVLAMANAGPDTNGSQFFVTQVDCPWLDGKHTVFGVVYKGQEFVDRMQVGAKIERVEVLWKRDHPYKVKRIEE